MRSHAILLTPLADEELEAIEAQCDGIGLIALTPLAQSQVRAMIAEIRRSRAVRKTSNRQDRRLKKLAKSLDLLQGKLDAIRLDVLGEGGS